MHYIRLLRPVSMETTNRREEVLSVLLTITTDLGDSFFGPDEPLALGATLKTGSRARVLACQADQTSPLQWRAGMRVLKAQLRLREPLPREKTTVCIFARSSGDRSKTPSNRPYWRHGYEDGQTELIVPVSVDMIDRVCAPVSLRTLPLPKRADGDDASNDDEHSLELGEDIGESIARHIWDAGLVTASFLSDSCRSAAVMADILPVRRDRINVLELGCGVGILGTTVAGIIWETAAAQGQSLVEAHVLLTDVDEAEERARANIARAEGALERRRTHVGAQENGEEDEIEEKPRAQQVQLQYENLDWDDGRQGAFGPLAAARAWDVVVLSDCTYNVDSLPALVGTLSALHRHSHSLDANTATRVILATKPRHASEEALFGLLGEQGWSHRVVKRVPLPRVGAEDEGVEVYVLERKGGQE
ncbi:uncharacterized protein PG986_010358 [Apiospora aurea]|uniref:Uncharacterized protein n=1 Tax=Apiospora aurea TaxID=335848 RepID=A0ABR1Q213_9PEZI